MIKESHVQAQLLSLKINYIISFGNIVNFWRFPTFSNVENIFYHNNMTICYLQQFHNLNLC